ncbi:hypothetical protein MUCCIDRAFT_111306 [Mucor lusitanicus CBS 277.49]|uniref:Uncharacterized protein n=1 Tax=Mucor lusitanicus CBS 277.49 TaxID=747725 RepID=A0A168K3M6_MUCCL|nr:hypothetical protein MUCCIDRAFT_111306 [Mucor lusitanicus CBS 277.49]
MSPKIAEQLDDAYIHDIFQELDFGAADDDDVLLDVAFVAEMPGQLVQDFALPDQARRVYRKDEFASNVNFGGYMYHPPPGVSVGPYNVYKLQIYATIKTSFYKVQRQKQRSSAYDIEPNEVASNNSNYNDTFTSTLRVINDIRGESYPARAEFTLLLGDAVNLIQERDDAFRLLCRPGGMIFIPTAQVCDFYSYRIRGIEAILDATVRTQDINQGHYLTLIAILCYVFNSLFSRPPSLSKWRPCQRLLMQHSVADSYLLLLGKARPMQQEPPPPGASVGSYNIYKLQTYATIKTSFYKVQRHEQISNTYDNTTLKEVATVNAEDYTSIFRATQMLLVS